MNKDNLDVNGLFSFNLVFYESDMYASKWLKKYKCMLKRSPRGTPLQQSSVGGLPPPPALSKVGKYEPISGALYPTDFKLGTLIHIKM